LKHLIWDWNGTLLDDVDCCVALLNRVLADRKMEPVTRRQYRERFGFPVRDFYEGLGIDFTREDYGDLSVDFVSRYRARFTEMALQRGALQTLESVRKLGIGQSVVSAMESNLLTTMLKHFGVESFFEQVRGRLDLAAVSKVDIGVALLKEMALAPAEVLLVGDTLHDLETARAMGCRCLLFSGGHQTRPRLGAAGADIVDDLGDVVSFVSADVV
jgi:phosphoglycolate phosphatase